MSFIDWNQAQPNQPAGIVPAAQQSALFGLQQGQRTAALSALNGVDIGDPGSVNSALQGLLKAGAVDQAKALTDLAMTRGVNTATLPVIQGALGLAHRALNSADAGMDGGSAPSPAAPSTADAQAAHQRIMGEASAATQDLLSTPDPAQRQQKAAAYRAHFLQEGVPQQNVDEVLGDLSNQGLQSHADFLKYAASNDPNASPVDHPTGFAATNGLINSPGYAQAADTLNGPLMQPIVQASLAKYAGLDLGGAIGQDLAITGPARGAAANLAFAGQTAQAGAAGAAIGSGEVGSPPVAGARLTFNAQGAPDAWILPDGTTQAIQRTAQANANITAAPAGGHVTTDAQGNPTGVAPTAGYAPTAAGVASTVGAAGVSGPAAAQELQNDRQTAANAQAQMIPLRKVYDTLPTTNVGPGTQAVNGWRSFVISQLPLLSGLIPGGLDAAKVQTANSDELKKYMVQIAGGQAAQYGQGTNEKLAVAASGNPNPDMSNLAARDVTRMNIALLRAQQAKVAAFDETGQPQTDYPSWAATYARTVDPRAFMLDLLSPPERQKTLSTITTTADKRAFLNGKRVAEQSGIYSEGDIPR